MGYDATKLQLKKSSPPSVADNLKQLAPGNLFKMYEVFADLLVTVFIGYNEDP
jgi:hypothetical protein